MTKLGRTALMSLSAAIALGVVGVPGALAQGNNVSSSSSSSASSSLGLTYVVAKNDSLSRIASRVNVPMSELLVVNGFTRTSVILPGQVIKLPDTASATPVATPVVSKNPSVSVTNSSNGPTYVVQRNDSLSKIASTAKVSLRALLTANNFTRTSVIVPGQVIKLPTGAATPANVTATTPASVTVATPANVTVATPASVPAATSTKLQQVLDFAHAQVGKPYKFATAGPSTYDCSGLTLASYAVAGVKLPHRSLAQSKLGVVVDWKTTPIQAGDLIFTYSSVDSTQISHVGIAVSSTHWIEAPNTGSVVRISKLPSATRIQAVRRFL
ncbi:MAG: LysM peptidoglycan-binding domain-containing protein [Ilumatobacteraceae bacterium]|jgi:LysM repeat protein|nr:LysM peptidoglycan-binding domain-containing protein [Ilumatobacteraceae bacterium]